MKPYLFISAALLCAACACSRKPSPASEETCVPAYSVEWTDSVFIADPTVARIYRSTIYPLSQAIAHQDKRRVASMVGYPMLRPYPFRPVRSEQELIDGWDLLFDDAYCRLLAEATPDDWALVGWRGIMLRNGDLWLDEYCSGDTTRWAIRFIRSRTAAREQEEKRLIGEEADLLGLSLGERPVGCYIAPDSSVLAYVSAIDSYLYRLRIFCRGDELTAPAYEVLAKRGIDGSCGNEYYYGSTGDTIVRLWDYDCGGREPEDAYGCAVFRSSEPCDEYTASPDSAVCPLEPCVLRDVAYLWQ